MSELININTDKMIRYQKVLSMHAIEHGDIYAISDTETTGTMIIDPKSGLFNRVLEWSVCFAYKNVDGLLVLIEDEDGPVVFDEPINPFIEKIRTKMQEKSCDEINKESIPIHGITLDYLFGISEGLKGRTKLPRKASPFEDVYESLIALVSIPEFLSGKINIKMVFHNASFDVKFLNNECRLIGEPGVEVNFLIEDTLDYAKKIFRDRDFKSRTLDSIHEYGVKTFPDVVKTIDRPIHTALIDSLMLVNVYNTIVLHRKKVKEVSVF